MKLRNLIVLGFILSLTAGACQQSHKLVATGGQQSIAMYPDEKTYLDVSHQAQQGGISGMVGSAKKGMSSKDIADQTPVKILSSDSNGATVQIISGPMKGETGFVAKQNVK
ncbi:MAG: hypothetical protein ACREQX_06010 [Candidatus Binataceae bacterium]